MPRAQARKLRIPLLAASVNPEETPFFRKELTGETHKAEGERVRGGGEEWKKGGRVREDRKSWEATWVCGEPIRIQCGEKKQRGSEGKVKE